MEHGRLKSRDYPETLFEFCRLVDKKIFVTTQFPDNIPKNRITA